MEEVAYRSQVQITRDKGPDRTATLPVGEQVRFGIHSEIAEHYGADPDVLTPISATLDYIVAAAGG